MTAQEQAERKTVWFIEHTVTKKWFYFYWDDSIKNPFKDFPIRSGWTNDPLKAEVYKTKTDAQNFWLAKLSKEFPVFVDFTEHEFVSSAFMPTVEKEPRLKDYDVWY